MPPQPGRTGQNRHRKWCRFSSYVGAANCDDADVSRVEVVDQPLDGAALARRVPALEDDAQRRPDAAAADLPAESEPQPEQARLLRRELLRLLLARRA